VTGSLLSIVPLIAAFLMLQRHWQTGLGTGSVKAWGPLSTLEGGRKMRITSSAVAVAAAAATLVAVGTASGASGTLTVSGAQWGVSTCYIGGTEGNIRFDASDLVGAGMNTYRIYGGMSRWETADDDGVYGSPSIAEIKADPNRVNWAHWDAVMTSPPNGSDYNWSGTRGPSGRGTRARSSRA
jgi:hypothetical protein